MTKRKKRFTTRRSDNAVFPWSVFDHEMREQTLFSTRSKAIRQSRLWNLKSDLEIQETPEQRRAKFYLINGGVA